MLPDRRDGTEYPPAPTWSGLPNLTGSPLPDRQLRLGIGLMVLLAAVAIELHAGQLFAVVLALLVLFRPTALRSPGYSDAPGATLEVAALLAVLVLLTLDASGPVVLVPPLPQLPPLPPLPI